MHHDHRHQGATLHRIKPQTKCARTSCGHFHALHSMTVTGPGGVDVVVQCGYVSTQPAFGGLFRLKACSCSGFVVPAPRRLRLTTWALERLPFLSTLAVIVLAFLILGVGMVAL